MVPTAKTDPLIISKKQWRTLFLAASIMTILLYLVAMIFSINGSDYFILNYQNSNLDNIESFLRQHQIMPILNWTFSTIEFCIVMSFIIKKPIKWYYVLPFYVIRLILSIPFELPRAIDIIYPIAFYIGISLIDQAVTNKKISFNIFLFQLLRLIIAMCITLYLQTMILVIKQGYFDGINHIMNLSATFIYAIEYDIALSVMLFTIALLFDKEKGDNVCTTYQHLGGSSQTSTTKSPKFSVENLTKTQKNRIRKLYARMYAIQLGTFLLVMVLPFLFGKVFEFLTMYVAFAIARYILGFKYSLHFKKESICVSASLIVFGILSLVVPFFYVVIICAIIFGIALAILLHLSYKYKSLWLFNKVAKPDKFALLYTFFDGNLDKHYVKTICMYHGLDYFQTQLIIDYVVRCEKISYMAHTRNYSQRMLIYKLDEAINKLISE